MIQYGRGAGRVFVFRLQPDGAKIVDTTLHKIPANSHLPVDSDMVSTQQLRLAPLSGLPDVAHRLPTGGRSHKAYYLGLTWKLGSVRLNDT